MGPGPRSCQGAVIRWEEIGPRFKGKGFFFYVGGVMGGRWEVGRVQAVL